VDGLYLFRKLFKYNHLIKINVSRRNFSCQFPAVGMAPAKPDYFFKIIFNHQTLDNQYAPLRCKSLRSDGIKV
jgi:hypothetical protein